MNGNPFSDFLTSGIFLPVGRTEILNEIAQVITLPQLDSRDLHGLPGMGKSSLLRYVHSKEFIREYKKVFFEPYSKKPELLFIAYISGWIESVAPSVLIYREYLKEYRRYWDQMAGTHPDLGLPDAQESTVGDHDGSDALSVMESHLRDVAQAGVRVVLLLDEFDSRWAYMNIDADESAKLGGWKESICSFILATERELVEVNPATKGSPLYKGLPQTPVREMWADDAREFVRSILAQQKVKLPDRDIEHMLALAGGHPYLLILAGRALWDFRRRTGLVGRPDEPLPDNFRPYLKQRLYDEFQRMFEQYFINRSEAQRESLLGLAEKGKILDDSAAKDPQLIQLAGLEKYGLWNVNDKGEIELFSELFRQYLRSQAAPTPLTPTATTSPTADASVTEPQLTALQVALYEFFRSNPGQVLTFEELGEMVWAWSADYLLNLSEEDKQKIRIAVSKLRRELDRVATGERIINLRSHGYRFEPARG